MVNIELYGKCDEKAGKEIDYDMTLEYYMISEPLCEEYSDLMRYGIKIVKTAVYKDGTVNTEQKEIRDIFYRKQEAQEFIKMLIANKVTPTGFLDVVEEYIASRLLVFQG